MNARYLILHDTCYHYDSPVSLAQQLAHLWPRECNWQRCTEQQLLISPDPTARRDELDVFGNPLTRLAFERPHDELQVNARLTVEVLARPLAARLAGPRLQQMFAVAGWLAALLLAGKVLLS